LLFFDFGTIKIQTTQRKAKIIGKERKKEGFVNKARSFEAKGVRENFPYEIENFQTKKKKKLTSRKKRKVRTGLFISF